MKETINQQRRLEMKSMRYRRILVMLILAMGSLSFARSLRDRDARLMQDVGGLINGLMGRTPQQHQQQQHVSPRQAPPVRHQVRRSPGLRGNNVDRGNSVDSYTRRASEQQRRLESDRLRQFDAEQRRLQKEADNQASLHPFVVVAKYCWQCRISVYLLGGDNNPQDV